MEIIKYRSMVHFMKTRRVVRCLIVVLIWSGWAFAVHAAPQIKFAQTTFDCGDVNANTTATHTFAFKNTGDELLKIESLQSP